MHFLLDDYGLDYGLAGTSGFSRCANVEPPSIEPYAALVWTSVSPLPQAIVAMRTAAKNAIAIGIRGLYLRRWGVLAKMSFTA